MTPNGKPSRKLKIPCANNTCGFDPHHRHQASSPDFFQVPGCFIFVANHTFVFSGKMLTMALAEDTLLEKSRCV